MPFCHNNHRKYRWNELCLVFTGYYFTIKYIVSLRGFIRYNDYMKEFNLIAVLGLYLICSPQAFGQNGDYFASRMAIESPKQTRHSQDKVYKIHPYQKELTLIQRTSFPKISIINDAIIGSYTTKPMVVNIRQNSRPKIIEHA